MCSSDLGSYMKDDIAAMSSLDDGGLIRQITLHLLHAKSIKSTISAAGEADNLIPLFTQHPDNDAA